MDLLQPTPAKSTVPGSASILGGVFLTAASGGVEPLRTSPSERLPLG